jgi:hypothetical protein
MPEQERMSTFDMPRYRIRIPNGGVVPEYAYLEPLRKSELNSLSAALSVAG